jgi:putative hemolysin
MNILLILLLTLLNAVFAMSEMALTASRRALLSNMADEGDKGAKAALELMAHPTNFLSTVQVGITSIGMLNGIVGEAAFSGGVALWLQSLGATPGVASGLATALVITVITFLTIVFGELVPKRVGQLYPEAVARLIARPMMGVAMVAKPFVRLLSISTHAVLMALKVNATGGRTVTQEEISASLEEGVESGLIERHEHQMLQNVFRLDDRGLTSLMIPRSEIEWLDAEQSVDEVLRRMGKMDNLGEQGQEQVLAVHSWYPVCKGSLDEVLGVVSVAQMLGVQNKANMRLIDLVQPAQFLPETLSGLELLEQFKAKVERLVFVVDEYGVVQGLVTPLDLLEAITGELRPDAQGEAWATQRDDGSWLLDGLMPTDELKRQLGMETLPAEERGLYNTLAGLLMFESGRLPGLGEKVTVHQVCFEVIDLDGRRIDKVLATVLPQVAAPASQEP